MRVAMRPNAGVAIAVDETDFGGDDARRCQDSTPLKMPKKRQDTAGSKELAVKKIPMDWRSEVNDSEGDHSPDHLYYGDENPQPLPF